MNPAFHSPQTPPSRRRVGGITTVPSSLPLLQKTYNLTVDIVSFDDKAKTIKVKHAKGALSTAPLLGKAVAESRMFLVGDRVVITCRNKGVTALRRS